MATSEVVPYIGVIYDNWADVLTFLNSTETSSFELTGNDDTKVSYFTDTLKNLFNTNYGSSIQSISLDLDTSGVTDMSYMFYNCTSLVDLDLKIDASDVTTMESMFYNCCDLEQLVLYYYDTNEVYHDLNTINVTNMSKMFSNCSGLTELVLSVIDTSNVINMEKMFYNCSSLETLTLYNWDISNVTEYSDMFYGCSSLTKVYVSDETVKTFIDERLAEAGLSIEAELNAMSG